MKLPNGYEITNTTQLKVKYTVDWSRGLLENEVHWLHKMRNLTECQRAYVAARDEANLGASEFGDGEVYDQHDQLVCVISYNGRAWQQGSEQCGSILISERPKRDTLTAH